MPTYEFVCAKCNKTFARIWSLTEYEKQKQGQNKCPGCGSADVSRKLSLFQVKTSKKS